MRRPLSSTTSVTGGACAAWAKDTARETARDVTASAQALSAWRKGMDGLCYGPLRPATLAPAERTLTRRCPVTIVYLALAATLEVSGDFLMRVGLGGRRSSLVAGACALAADRKS